MTLLGSLLMSFVSYAEFAAGGDAISVCSRLGLKLSVAVGSFFQLNACVAPRRIMSRSPQIPDVARVVNRNPRPGQSFFGNEIRRWGISGNPREWLTEN